MKYLIITIEIVILIFLSGVYVIPHWDKLGLSFSDLFVLECYYLLGTDLYNKLKEKI